MNTNECTTFQNVLEKALNEPIIFHLDLVNDQVRFSSLTELANNDRQDDVIEGIQTTLSTLNFVHPDDISAYDLMLQEKTDDLSFAATEIRIRNGDAGYRQYRLYSVSTRDDNGKALSINGVMVNIGENTVLKQTSQKQEEQNALFRQAVTSDAVMSLCFNAATGERIPSDLDIVPQGLAPDAKLREVALFLYAQNVHMPDLHKQEAMLANIFDTDGVKIARPFYSECKMRDLSQLSTDYRWYRVYHSFAKMDSAQQGCFFITVVDIHDLKTKEMHVLELSMYDPMTDMLNRNAFETQVAKWLQRMKNETVYPWLCAVIILVDNPIEIVHLRGRGFLSEKLVQLSKSVKALVHPHELCCRYGLSEFAMVFAGSDRDTLNERLKILQFVLNAQSAEDIGLRILYGSNIETAAEAEHSELFLGKAYQALLNARERHTDGNATYTPAPSVVGDTYQPTSVADKAPAEEGRTIFVRTFGHFDVFVDDEPVLFSHPKARELLALMVDRCGGFVRANEAIACLWEDEPSNEITLARWRKAALQLKQTLRHYGIEQIVDTVRGKRRVVKGTFVCDYYQYLDDRNGINRNGSTPPSYLSEYSWAESSIGTL